MTKTIEEAARVYAAQVDKNVEELYGIEQPTSLTFGECAAESFRAGAAHVLSLPLSQRLTDEEREKIREKYQRLYANGYISACGFRLELEEIFGKELFEEGEVC